MVDKMKVLDLQKSCKTRVFKDLIRDMIFSIRQSVWKLTNNNIDIKLSKISLTPIMLKSGEQFNVQVTNLVGGNIAFLIDNNFIEFIKMNVEFDESNKIFINDVIDFFSHSQDNILKLKYSEKVNNWEDNLYYVKLNIKINLKLITSIIIAVDEITSLYFVY